MATCYSAEMGLFRLPLELRLKIYALAAGGNTFALWKARMKEGKYMLEAYAADRGTRDGSWAPWFALFPRDYAPDAKGPAKDVLALLLTCRRIHDESIPIVYTQNWFVDSLTVRLDEFPQILSSTSLTHLNSLKLREQYYWQMDVWGTDPSTVVYRDLTATVSYIRQLLPRVQHLQLFSSMRVGLRYWRSAEEPATKALSDSTHEFQSFVLFIQLSPYHTQHWDEYRKAPIIWWCRVQDQRPIQYLDSMLDSKISKEDLDEQLCREEEYYLVNGYKLPGRGWI